jgi:DNA-binding beta-propeller fold protein YncE
VGAVLGDALRRVSVLGGREGMPRSLGSVLGGSVTRFLGGSWRGVVSRVIPTPKSAGAGDYGGIQAVAVSRDGSVLLALASGLSDIVTAFAVVDGSRRVVVGRYGLKPLQFRRPVHLHVAPDDFVFVADYGNKRVQVLTPTLDFHGFIGEGVLGYTTCVCADADVVVVGDIQTSADERITVFGRSDGAVIRRFGSNGSGDGQLKQPRGLCFLSSKRLAVADTDNHRVSVFSLRGEFVRHVGVGALKFPADVAASAFDEIVVANGWWEPARVFSDVGDLLLSLNFGAADFVSVAVHGGTLFTEVRAPAAGYQCVVWC